jgi:UV DNA damage endonuclease
MLSAELLDANRLHVTIPFLRSIAHLDTDVMLESKAKDLALLRLRADIARYAPDLAARYGISAASDSDDAGEIEVEDSSELNSSEAA